MKNFNKPFSHKKGAALVYVLITFLVLTMLTTAILSIGSAETRFSSNDTDKTKAYYIARSGAEAFAQSAQTNTSFAATGAISFGGGNFDITVDTTNPSIPVIISKGKYKNSEKIVKLSLIPKSLFPTTIFAKNNVQMDNNSDINGSVEMAAGGTVTGVPGNIHGTITYNSTKTFPDIPMHYTTTSAPNIYGGTINGTPNVYNNMNIGSSYLNVNTGGNRVEIDATQFSGNNCNVHVYGGGTFILHTYNFNFKGNFYTDADTTSVIVIAPSGSAYADFQTGNSVFQAFIYGPSADVDIRANMSVTGAVIAKTVTMESGGNLTFPASIPYIDPTLLNITPSGYDKNKWED